MRIVVDVMGGDHGCEVVVHGAKLALDNYTDISELYLVGNQAEIESACQRVSLKDGRVQVVHATQVVTMEDKPVDALRKKKDSSILRAVDLLKEGKAEALVSPGNTGGIVAASAIRLRTLEGVDRPALAAVMPSSNGEFVLIDAGANPDCKAIHFAQFAIMGSIYSREILKKPNPRVGILSNGTEEIKGTELTREALKLCEQLNLEFIGYVEGHQLFKDEVDVVVTDGFVGNIVLKSCESLAKGIFGLLKSELTANPIRKLGAMLAQGGFRTLKRRMDPEVYGGAPLLGVNGIVIKAHGSARERAVMNAIRVARETIQHKLNFQITQDIAAVNRLVAAQP
ncbi:MAG: phosphate acyltransferase PlsX [Verrucomicrobiota bacterium]|nr:phosphate acyltransferase PlsX [Verrucomicrobiota bacterium]